jgi:hypothetical protein
MRRKENVMRYLSRKFVENEIIRAVVMLSAVGTLLFAPGLFANNKPTEVPAEVIAHLPLKEAPGSDMLLRSKGDQQYLYVQKASKQGYMVVDVTRPSIPALLNVKASGDATAGTLQMAGPDAALAEIPDKNSKGVLHGTEGPAATVKLLDLTDPAHPKVLQTFNGVTGTLQDPGRALIYLVNKDGLWVLRHSRPGIAPAKAKRKCGSEDALAAMPPDCQ